jgi:hypothetical protein
MTQHASLSPERWAAFSRDQQILMIGNEMNRATRLIRLADRPGLLLAYERVLRLVDLTVEVQPGYGLRRELLRWRASSPRCTSAPAPRCIRINTLPLSVPSSNSPRHRHARSRCCYPSDSGARRNSARSFSRSGGLTGFTK